MEFRTMKIMTNCEIMRSPIKILYKMKISCVLVPSYSIENLFISQCVLKIVTNEWGTTEIKIHELSKQLLH